MRKLFSIMLVTVLTVSLLSGCNKKAQNTDTVQTEEDTAEVIPTVEAESPEPTGAETVETETKKIDINIAAMTGPTGMGMVKVMEDSENSLTANQYNFTIAGTADEISGGIVKGDYDIAAVPCNLASVLYNKSQGGIVVAGINTLGVLYIVETGTDISSVEDIKGKTIYSTGKGTTPEYTLNYLLSSHGIDPEKDVKIEYKSEAAEVAALLSESTDAVAMLPQPFVTTVMMNNDKIRIALDVSEEWSKVSDNGSSIVTGVVVVNKAFLDSNREAVEAFLEEYEVSTKYVNEKTEEAAELIEKFNIFKAAIAKKAIPYCNITFIRGDEMQTKIQGYLEVLFDQNPNAVGGTIPEDAFYYKN